MEFFWIFLVLALLVTVFGFGVVLANRRRSGTIAEPPVARPLPKAAAPAPTAPADVATDVTAAGVAVAEPPVAEPAVVAPPAKPASLRDRLSKARSTFSGAFAGVLGRTAITDESWDDLE